MKKNLILFKISLILTLNIACFNSYSTTDKKMVLKTIPPSNENISYLFLQIANQATIKALDKKSPSNYQLTLKNVRPYTNYFSDRPHRISGMLTLHQFLNGWRNGADSFQINPPNVAISGEYIENKLKKSTRSFIMELKNPIYIEATNTVTYDVTFLSKVPEIGDQKEINLNHVTVFFDDLVCPSCCCG